MLDIDDTRRPGARHLYEKFITWGAPIQLRSATPIYLEPTKAEPTNLEPPVSETPAIVEPVAAMTELPDPAPGTLPSQFSF
jgi:hypothetical protein